MYTGPIPPAPTAESTDAQWSSWWAYQTVLTNGRYDDERAARQIVTDRQHDERIAADEKLAAAQKEWATAGMAIVVALAEPSPRQLPTRAELVFSILRDMPQATILTAGQLTAGARSIVDAYAAAYPAAVSA